MVTLLKTAKQVNLTLVPINLSRKLKKLPPAWFQVGVSPALYDRCKTPCLKDTHQARTIRQSTEIFQKHH